ncbi:fibronectin type III domain-containing protein [Rubrivirga sp. IMCC45206]|uniref:fibronectin type III domain-containing protein n=1 Tax=Rubrivirga sp. IMCC45206 TaxID=3391614 RepID=UPI00398FAB58
MPVPLRVAALALLALAACDSADLPVFNNPSDPQLPGERLVDPPASIQIEPATPTSLVLRWTDPGDGEGFVVFEVIRSCDPFAGPCGQVRLGEVGPATTSFEVTGLTGTADRRFAVATRGELGGRSAIGVSPVASYSGGAVVAGGAGDRGVISADGSVAYGTTDEGGEVIVHDLASGARSTIGGYGEVVGPIGADRALVLPAAAFAETGTFARPYAVVHRSTVVATGTLAAPPGEPESVVVSADGRRAAGTFAADGGIELALWDLDSGGTLRGASTGRRLRPQDVLLGVVGDLVLVNRILDSRIEAVDLTTDATAWTVDGVAGRAEVDGATATVLAFRSPRTLVPIDAVSGAVGAVIPANPNGVGRPAGIGPGHVVTIVSGASPDLFVTSRATGEVVRVIEGARSGFVGARVTADAVVVFANVDGGTVTRVPFDGRWGAVAE